jgi:hypothetical protein
MVFFGRKYSVEAKKNCSRMFTEEVHSAQVTSLSIVPAHMLHTNIVAVTDIMADQAFRSDLHLRFL